MAKQDPRIYIRVTHKDLEYTAIACGFHFKNGIAYAFMDIRDGCVDRVKIDNVMTIFAGTSYKILTDEVDIKTAQSHVAEVQEKIGGDEMAALRARIREEERTKLLKEMEVANAESPQPEIEKEEEDEPALVVEEEAEEGEEEVK